VAITGGYVVRNHDLQSLYGRYVYADYCTGDVRSLKLGLPAATDDSSTGLAPHAKLQSFGEDSCGHLYTANSDGEVNLIVDSVFTPCPEPPKPQPKPPGGGGPPPGGGDHDTTPPGLLVKRERRQPLSRHRSLYVTVGCDERCGVTASATIKVHGAAHGFALPRVARGLGAGARLRVRLLLTRHSAAVVRRALRAGRRVRAKVRVVARDPAGNQTAKTVRVRVLL
jgi:hypothetical protein